ncbi:tetratricopeptide repeat protein [Oceanispirochaeta sp.]|uniref:tetratricopeptide repeat protein n=1 Tax=Oceanispirochaeta sp. TaxID=2035350 RepID=UPI00262D6967|nr:tetratricopeptide repeat protein [Oceanispirochaeta sp.]MDA3958770.1 tetratricopeptide repeat protein [Oceanispirochaeta sp.]
MPLLIPFIIIIVALFIIVSVVTGKDKKDLSGNQIHDRNSILKEANKRLASNPKDSQALTALADLHFAEQNYPQAMKTYGILMDLCATNSRLDEHRINLNFGLSAMKAKVWTEAYKSLTIARTKEPENFDINASMGVLEYRRKNYEKSVAYLMQALKSVSNDHESLRYCGLSLYKLRRFKEASTYLRSAATGHPDDKEALFSLARSLFEIAQMDQALKIFSHLRADPDWGPKSALYSGTVNKQKREYDKAIMDFEIGLKHKEIAEDVLLELKYRLADCYNQTSELDKALEQLNDLYGINPKYKDVEVQRKKIKELTGNRNLQTYLIAPISEFITLCRQLTLILFPKTRIKVMDISVHKNEYVDILAEVKARKWEDLIVFRFYRDEGKIGDFSVRELYARVKEVHAGRGFCLTAGVFSEEAQQFVEARLIDLLPKENLMKLLNKLKISSQPSANAL